MKSCYYESTRDEFSRTGQNILREGKRSKSKIVPSIIVKIVRPFSLPPPFSFLYEVISRVIAFLFCSHICGPPFNAWYIARIYALRHIPTITKTFKLVLMRFSKSGSRRALFLCLRWRNSRLLLFFFFAKSFQGKRLLNQLFRCIDKSVPYTILMYVTSRCEYRIALLLLCTHTHYTRAVRLSSNEFTCAIVRIKTYDRRGYIFT